MEENNIIELSSRDEERIYLSKLTRKDEKESKTYSLKLSSPIIRTGFTDEGNKFIDPPGGPMIIEGKLLEEAGKVVKYINYVMGYGYTITFE